MTVCQVPECNREPMRSSGGNVYTRCEAHIRTATADAFAPEWVKRAREGRLPIRIEGGVKA